MIKILRIINRFNLGGPTYNATYLTAYLPEQYQTKLIGGSHEEHEGASTFILDEHKVKYEIVDSMQREISFANDKKALKELRQIIREFKPDIVHTHASKAGFLGRLAAAKENVPIVVHTFHGHVFHSYFGNLKTGLYKKLERYVAKKTDVIIAISEIQKKELCEIHKIAPCGKFRVIPLGFDLDRFRENKDSKRLAFRNKYEIKDDELAIGIIGRLTAIKNHSLFIQSISASLTRTDKKLKVLIIGDGELMKEIKEECAEVEQQIGKQIFVFTSWIKNISEALPGLDLVCLSSKNEGTPVSLIEAQAAGVPVVTTNVGGVLNVVDNGNTGIVVDGFEVKDYANALLDLINNEEKRAKMSQNGWNHVEEKFHYLRLCKDMDNLYQELLEKKGLKK
ncbi:glycosyltransferase [Paracrocinitomix mangrovi]|uniref:glycosyltransferase n=1 Tax=Paracrocinitomix mangrovi TaxID=2862509 RepID=UPI001C8DDE8B|nr:glycosyltransferase [Paracrocinitomix mangrovi]UKN02218.1 glycosyltransferase [Paracrocinitomix mangrovi]